MSKIYAALANRLLVITPNGDSWDTMERLQTHDLECVAASSSAPDRIFCGTFDAGLWRSTDAGDAWDRIGKEKLPKSISALAIDPQNPEEVWVGTEPSAVYRSTDGGDEWEQRPGLTDLPSASVWSFPPRPHTHHVRWIEVDPGDPAHLYVSIEAGALVQTHDAGETWEDRRPSSRRDNHSLTTHSDAPGRAYAAAGDGYAKSTDGGTTWTYPETGLDHRYCWSVAVDPSDPDTVLLSSASGPRMAHSVWAAESYVYLRSGDAPWERVMTGLPDPDGLLRASLATTDEPRTFYALTNHGLYQSTDAGEAWSRCPMPWPDEYRNETPQGLAVVT